MLGEMTLRLRLGSLPATMQPDEKLTVILELESATCAAGELASRVVRLFKNLVAEVTPLLL